MKPLSKAIVVGAVSAALTWGAVCFVLHQPSSWREPDGSVSFVITCPGDDDDVTALLWAAGAYILTFTPALLFLRGRATKDVFTARQPIG